MIMTSVDDGMRECPLFSGAIRAAGLAPLADHLAKASRLGLAQGPIGAGQGHGAWSPGQGVGLGAHSPAQ
jgi:hypothetical protein